MRHRLLPVLACTSFFSCTAFIEGINKNSQGGHTAHRAAVQDVEFNAHPLNQVADKSKELVGAKQCTIAERNRFELTAEDEYWFGRSVAARLLARYTPGNVYAPESPAALYVNQVGQVAAAAAVSHLDTGGAEGSARAFPAEPRLEATPDRPMPTHGYQFILVHDAAPNAYAVPGGFIIITDGILARAASEDELAAVLAHEVAHVQRGHGIEVIKELQCRHKNSLLGMAGDAMRDASGNGSAVALLPLGKAAEVVDTLSKGLVDAITGDGYGSPYELEADACSARYLAGSGYRSRALAELLGRMDRDPGFVAAQSRSHPPPKDRIARIDEAVQAEHLDPGSAPPPPARTQRFVQAQSDAGVRPLVRSER